MDMKMRVLFVDDQPEILAGLRRMLHGLRNEWQMEFAESGEEALKLMAESAFDVVVSDMRMPGMDGAQLLTEVMKRYPGTVRIILSGQAGQVSIMKAVTPAHQYLSKPCDAETLKATVARACALRDTLNQKSLIRLVSQVTTLPSLPHVYTKLLEELQSEDSSVQGVAELIAQDIGMTAKLMQMVNSSFFGIPKRVESPKHAAAMLGLNVLKPLVLSAGIFSQFRADGLQGYSVDALMEHSLAVSHLAQQIAKSHSDDKELAEDALLAGLLHDVGQLLLVANLQEQYGKTLALARENEISLCDAEFECLGATHADVGAYLLGLWGLANPIVEAVAFHHQPMDCTANGFGPLTAVHVANVLANEAQISSGITYSLDIDVDYLEHLGVADQLPKWRDMTDNFYAARV
ncbi:MAG: HDOD domain-containing protein [Planctomycetes bacterium]|nr:HDOD domain-containing protein [Planctomycetota bacterium]